MNSLQTISERKATDSPLPALSKRHMLFAEFYIEFMNDAKAARMAGYAEWDKTESALRIRGQEIRRRPEVDAYIAARLPEHLKGIVLQEYVDMAQYDLRKRRDKNGNLLPIHKLDDATARAVSAGGSLAKREALRVLAEHIRFFPDSNEGNVNNFFAPGSAPQFNVAFVAPKK